ncbi:hypothetical protein ACGFWI_08740 [Streptomyces sp. NPDC048434]
MCDFSTACGRMKPTVRDQLSAALIVEYERDDWLDGERCGRLRVG